MIVEVFWVVASTALLTFCLRALYLSGYKRGYQDGGFRILEHWRQSLKEYEEVDNNDK